MTSIVFPGQGSQFIGMAKDFYDNFHITRKIFEEIEEYTKLNLKNIIFENNHNKLNLTQFTQISIFATSVSIFKTLQNEKFFKDLNIKVMLGHSLGDYTALACSNKLSLKESSLILKKRGELMNNSILPNTTGMAALIGQNANTVQKIIDENKLDLQIANDNSPFQVVISGKIDEINKNKELFLQNKIKKYILLNVSAAFHSKYMFDAQLKLNEDIEKLTFEQNNINIISNYDAEIYNDNSSIKYNLQNQMANKVQWTQSIKKLEQIGETNIIEIGPGNVLSGLIKRISNNFKIKSINNISDINKND